MDYGQIIFDTVRGDGIPEPLSLLIVAQAKHETNNFQSNVFRTCLNAFGYKAVFGAPSCTGSPEGNNYEKYSSVVDSAHEISAWLFRRVRDGSFPPLNTISTPEHYSRLLKNSGYYGAPVSEYTAGLIRWLKEYKKPVAIGSVVLVGLVAWYVYRNRKK